MTRLRHLEKNEKLVFRLAKSTGVVVIFTFLRNRDVEPDNNRAERSLRPSVVMRKITCGNNSGTGARNHETLMSLVETARLRNADPLKLMIALAEDNGADAEKSLFGDNTATACVQKHPPPS